MYFPLKKCSVSISLECAAPNTDRLNCFPEIFKAKHYQSIKGRCLKFRRYHNFANLVSKLSETTFYKEISKFQ